MTSAHSDIHFSALCNAIEHEKCEKARAILETHPALLLDQNNNDGFTPLDLAFMTGNQEILKLLIHHRHDEHSGKKRSSHLTLIFQSSHHPTLIFQSTLNPTLIFQSSYHPTIHSKAHIT